MTECAPICRVRIYRLVRFRTDSRTTERKKTKKWMLKILCLFGLECRSLSFEMHFCCTDVERYGHGERKRNGKIPRINDNIVYLLCNFVCDTILYVSVQLTKVGKYTHSFSSAIQNNTTKTNNKIFLVLFFVLLLFTHSPLYVWFEIRLAQVASLW